MKHGRKPTVKQCRLLTENGKDHTQWLVIGVTHNEITFRHRTTHEIITLPV